MDVFPIPTVDVTSELVKITFYIPEGALFPVALAALMVTGAVAMWKWFKRIAV